MKNTIICVKGEPLCFSVMHICNGETYNPAADERYQIKIKKDVNETVVLTEDSGDGKFEFEHNLDVGRYVFELSLLSSEDETVISPVTDEYGCVTNEIIITERL